jgi:membrane fusion protein, heavy metal efflux system
VQPPLAGSDHLTFLASRQQVTALRIELKTKAAEARTAATLAEVALRRAAQQLTRVRGLAERQAKSAREVEQAVYEHARAEAELRAAQARQGLYAKVEQQLGELPVDLSQGFPLVELKAPIAGVIVQAIGSQGEQVTADARLLTVLDRSKLHLEVMVPETALSRVPAQPGVFFTTPGQRQTYRQVLGEGGGRLLLALEAVDPKTRSARLVYELPNPGDLPAGLAVEAFVTSKTTAQALSISESALVEEEGRYVAFVMLGGETFEKRDLVLGVRDGGLVEVKSGLSEGDRVVISGAYAVKLASVSSSIPAHGHAH